MSGRRLGVFGCPNENQADGGGVRVDCLFKSDHALHPYDLGGCDMLERVRGDMVLLGRQGPPVPQAWRSCLSQPLSTLTRLMHASSKGKRLTLGALAALATGVAQPIGCLAYRRQSSRFGY